MKSVSLAQWLKLQQRLAQVPGDDLQFLFQSGRLRDMIESAGNRSINRTKLRAALGLPYRLPKPVLEDHGFFEVAKGATIAELLTCSCIRLEGAGPGPGEVKARCTVTMPGQRKLWTANFGEAVERSLLQQRMPKALPRHGLAPIEYLLALAKRQPFVEQILQAGPVICLGTTFNAYCTPGHYAYLELYDNRREAPFVQLEIWDHSVTHESMRVLLIQET